MTSSAITPSPMQRLLSLDVVRGITIAFMIMVNNNGGRGAWWFMHHAAWNGLTPTDLVFPTFLFIVGASTVLAFEARLARGATRSQLMWHTIQRAAILFVLGVVVNGWPFFALQYLRVYGVLQRIAICYLVAGLFYLYDKRVSTKIIALVAALVGYWVLVRWVPVPDAGMPMRDIPFLDPTQNLGAWLDRHLMPYHLYEDHILHNLRDPEGLLGDLPSLGTTLLGMLTGMLLRSQKTIQQKFAWLISGAIACLAAGYLWSISFPLNKKMWTSSYVLVAAGWSLVLLAAAFWAIEVKKWRKGWTWVWLVFGSNAIVAYMFSELLPGALSMIHLAHMQNPGHAWENLFTIIPNPGWSAFAYSVSFTAICFIPVWILFKKKIFVKI